MKSKLQQRWPNSLCYVFGHVGDGNLHLFISPQVSSESTDDAAQLHLDCDHDVYTVLAPFNGSVSAEHGIGMEKKRWLVQSRSDTEMTIMRALKDTLDPQCLLNPGRVLELQE